MGAFKNLPVNQRCITAHQHVHQTHIPATEIVSRSALQLIHAPRSDSEDLKAAFAVDFDDFFLDQMLDEVAASLDERGPSWLQETRGA